MSDAIKENIGVGDVVKVEIIDAPEPATEKVRIGNATFVKSGVNPRQRIMVATPTLGIVRMEWSCARNGQIIPTNWASVGCNISSDAPHDFIPLGYLTADAQNIAAQACVKDGHEWLILHEDDVVLPPNTFVIFNEYINKADVPIVSGLYYLKSEPSEPILYRGRGNSYFADFKVGDKVWVDGVPTGIILIHRSILEVLYNESEEYIAFAQAVNKVQVRKIFETPQKQYLDPQTRAYVTEQGTSDLEFCSRIIKEDILTKAGWSEIAKKEFPFLCDTRIFCHHIDLTTGRMYP